jgi:hypothetical protein
MTQTLRDGTLGATKRKMLSLYTSVIAGTLVRPPLRSLGGKISGESRQRRGNQYRRHNQGYCQHQEYASHYFSPPSLSSLRTLVPQNAKTVRA